MRVIAGQARGYALIAPEGLSTRPTADRVKETIFNVIQFELAGASVLDLFAGSGAMGIEALSRGAADAVFVDFSKESINAVNKNLEKTKLAGSASVLQTDFLRAIDGFSKNGRRFSIVFLDPPYYKGLTEKALRAISEAGLLADDGFIVAEMGSDERLPEIEGLSAYKQKTFSVANITFLRNEITE